MKQSNLGYRTSMVVCAVALLAFGCAPREPAGATPNGEKPIEDVARQPEENLPTEYGAGFAKSDKPGRVELTYQGLDDACAAEQPGDLCVLTDEPDATIWKDKEQNDGKPKKVRWWIPKAQKSVYYFEIAFKGLGGENWLQTVEPIDCQANHTTSIKPDPAELPSGDLEWPYRITVYSCTEEGEKGACLCKTDPRIQIHD